MHVHENEMENKLYINLFSVLRITSKELMQIYSLAYIKNKELNLSNAR